MPRGSYRHMLLLFAKKRIQSGTQKQMDWLVEEFQIGQIESAIDNEINDLATKKMRSWDLESGKPGCYEKDQKTWTKMRAKIWERTPDYRKKPNTSTYIEGLFEWPWA